MLASAPFLSFCSKDCSLIWLVLTIIFFLLPRSCLRCSDQAKWLPSAVNSLESHDSAAVETNSACVCYTVIAWALCLCVWDEYGDKCNLKMSVWILNTIQYLALYLAVPLLLDLWLKSTDYFLFIYGSLDTTPVRSFKQFLFELAIIHCGLSPFIQPQGGCHRRACQIQSTLEVEAKGIAVIGNWH